MKRATGFIQTFVISIAILGFVGAADAGTGFLWAKVLPAFPDTFLSQFLDHTYPCAANPNVSCFTYTGRYDLTGPNLDGSGGYGSVDKANCTLNALSCRLVFGLTGTCHQVSNRALSTPGTTVNRARGYGLSTFYFGTYGGAYYNSLGQASSWLLCRAACGI